MTQEQFEALGIDKSLAKKAAEASAKELEGYVLNDPPKIVHCSTKIDWRRITEYNKNCKGIISVLLMEVISWYDTV